MTPAASPRSNVAEPSKLSEKETQIAQKVSAIFRQNVQERTLIVDYKKPIPEVYKDFMKLALASALRTADHYPLDIICRPWAPPLPRTSKETPPSWMRRQTHTPFGQQKRKEKLGHNWVLDRQNADPLVRMEGRKRQFYSASRTYQGRMCFGKISENILTVEGFVYDTIAEISETCAGGVVTQDWLRFGGCDDDGGADDIPDQLWRTLVADRDLYGQPVQSLYRLAFKHITIGEPMELIPSRILSKHQPRAAIAFVERMEAVIWGRRMLKTAKFESLGIGHRNIRENDLVCIFFWLQRTHCTARAVSLRSRFQ